MRWLVKALVLVAALVAGADSGHSDQRVTRRWNATWSGDSAILGNCEAGALLIVDNGTGHSEHLGDTTWSSTFCMDPVTLNGSGIGVATAANGDEIRFQIAIHFIWTSPSSGNWTEFETVMGGTGRFVGVTGSSTTEGTSTWSATTAVWEGTSTGTLTY